MHKWGKGGTDPSLRDLASPGDLDCGSGGIPTSLGEAGPLPRRLALRTVYHCLLSICVGDAVCLFV
jgi:hypothetical protein